MAPAPTVLSPATAPLLSLFHPLWCLSYRSLTCCLQAVAVVLGFVGLKLGAEVCGVEISSAVSLGVIFSTLGGGVVLSLLAEPSRNEPPEQSNS